MTYIFMVQFLGRIFFISETEQNMNELYREYLDMADNLKITKVNGFTLNELKDLYLDPNR